MLDTACAFAAAGAPAPSRSAASSSSSSSSSSMSVASSLRCVPSTRPLQHQKQRVVSSMHEKAELPEMVICSTTARRQCHHVGGANKHSKVAQILQQSAHAEAGSGKSPEGGPHRLRWRRSRSRRALRGRRALEAGALPSWDCSAAISSSSGPSTSASSGASADAFASCHVPGLRLTLIAWLDAAFRQLVILYMPPCTAFA